ncbi:Putative uncharacterized protein encoded by CACTIN-AS1, partial [Fulmarus glacialis]
PSSAVTVTLEVEPELEDPISKLAAEAVAVGILPLTVDDLEGNVLVGRPGMEAQDGKVLVVLAGLQEVLRRRALVDEVRVEDVELVALHNLGGGVVEVVVGLVVLVPLEARVHAVEEAGLAGPVLISPEIGLAREGHFHAELCLIRTHALLGLAEEDVIGALGGITWPARGAPTCDLKLLTQKQQPMRILLGLQHMGIEGQLVGAQEPGAVLPRVIVVQALLDQVLLHQHSFPLCLSFGLCVLLSLRTKLHFLSQVPHGRRLDGCTPQGKGCVPVAGGGRLPLDDGEEGFALHTLLLLQLVQLLAQHILVPLPQP